MRRLRVRHVRQCEASVTVFVTESVRCRHRLVWADHTWGHIWRGWPLGTRWTSSGHTRRRGERLEWARAPGTGVRGKLGVIFVFTSKWSFPTLKVSVTLADLSSCSMLVRVEWSRKTSGFCFAEFTKSSVSEKDFENQEIAHLNYFLVKSVTVTALSLMSFGLWLWFSKALLNLLLFSFAHLLIGLGSLYEDNNFKDE